MNDLIAELDRRLSAMAPEITAEYLAERDSQPVAAARSRAARPRTGWLPSLPKLALGGATVALAIGVLALIGVFSGNHRLPLERTPVTDASAMTKTLPSLRNADALSAHGFAVPGSPRPGFLVPDPTTDQWCLAVPDVDGYGGTCEDRAKVERDGLAIVLSRAAWSSPGPDPLIVAVLPADATNVRLQEGDRETTPPVNDGVVAVRVQHDSTLRWDAGGTTHQVKLQLPAVATIAFLCKDGQQFSVPESQLPPGRNSATGVHRRLCAAHGGVDFGAAPAPGASTPPPAP